MHDRLSPISLGALQSMPDTVSAKGTVCTNSAALVTRMRDPDSRDGARGRSG